MKKIAINLLGIKGLKCLEVVIDKRLHTDFFMTVIVGRDQLIENDFGNEIIDLCNKNNIRCIERYIGIDYAKYDYVIAISWRWMISGVCEKKLIIFHDSLLPRYRGFAPLVNAAMNKEPFVGVTALFGSHNYDEGDIIAQSSIPVIYPINIKSLIDMIIPCYVDLFTEILYKMLASTQLIGRKQDEDCATYSIWLDAEDYFIDWSASSADILHKINLLGPPYKYAHARLSGEIILIHAAEIINDIKIERQHIGKVIFIKDDCPIVICGEGLIKLTSIFRQDGSSILPFNRFRVRFS